MDFTPFLRIKPDVARALATVDDEIIVANDILDAAQRNYDRLTTQAGHLRSVMEMLTEIENTPVQQ